MNPYAISGKTKQLEPLEGNNFDQTMQLIAREDVRKLSLMYCPSFNVMNDYTAFQETLINNAFSGTCRLFFVKGHDSSYLDGIVGLVNIDWQQLRCELLILMDRDNLIKKVSHEPVKNILIKAVKEWNMKRVVASVYDEDQWTKTVLKGFGFKEEGKLRDHVSYKNETFDICTMGLLGSEFHFVEDI